MGSRCPALLLFALACTDGGKPAERPVAIDSGSRPMMVSLARFAPVVASAITRTVDTTRLDSSLSIRIRTVSVTDSTVVIPLPRFAGIPFGPYSAWDSVTLKPGAEAFGFSVANLKPSMLGGRVTTAKRNGARMLVSFAGSDRRQVTTNGVFDPAKYGALLNTFVPLTPQILDAVNDGTIAGTIVMDEPFNRGGAGNEANGWGGVMTKQRVDSLCGLHRGLFPGLPTGVTHDHDDFEPAKSYRVCDFVLSQYRYAKGPVTAFRDSGLALARRDSHAIAFSMNILDGGIPAAMRRADGTRKTTWDATDCPLTTTGGRGTYFPNCRMTTAQLREYGLVLGPAGCAFTFWRFDAGYLNQPGNKKALQDVAAALRLLPPKPCRRS